MSTWSSNLNIQLIGTGEQSGTWGTTTNGNWQYVMEEAIVGSTTVSFSDANVTLTATQATTDQQYRNLVLNCSGTNTAQRSLIVPTIYKNYVVANNTTGGFAILVTTSGGTGITVPNGSTAYLYANGTNVVQLFNYQPTLTVGTLTATLSNALTAGTGLTFSSGSTYTGGSAVTLNATGATVNSQSGAYVAAASDAGKIISITTGGVTINNSVFSAGNVVTIYNNSGSSQTITQGSGVTLQWSGQTSSTTGNRTLALYSVASIFFLSASSAVISGNGLT